MVRFYTNVFYAGRGKEACFSANLEKKNAPISIDGKFWMKIELNT